MFPSSPPPRLRKRTRLDSIDDNESSDFVFSSDPVDAALDGDRRSKRVYKGTWWASDRAEYERNFDSGVFMASDDSLPSFMPDNALQSVANVTASAVSPAHLIVNRAIESGEEVIDLSNLGLSELAQDIPYLLQSLVRPPRFANGSNSPDDQEYQSLVSQIQLYLANNTLKALPPTIWSLENLTVLSLRNNGITNLPCGIGKLVQLEELNLSNNNLRWLPWELLQLLGGPEKRLTKLNVKPNPFLTGFDVSDFPRKIELPRTAEIYSKILKELGESAGLEDHRSEKDMPSRWLHKLLQGLWQTMEDVDKQSLGKRGPKCLFDALGADFTLRSFHVATSNIYYLRNDGTTIEGRRGSHRPSRTPHDVTCISADPYALKQQPKGTSRVPSLLEVSMTRCAASFEAERRDLGKLMPADTAIPVMRAINEIYESMDEGGRICSTCSRRYIIPRTEWIEFWHCIPKNASALNLDEMFWPFLRRGCSWACAP